MPYATLNRELLHQSQKPPHRAGRFDPHYDRRRNRGIELADGPAFVLQRLFDDLTGVAVQHRNRLLARMQIATNQPHLGLLQSERGKWTRPSLPPSTRIRRR